MYNCMQHIGCFGPAISEDCRWYAILGHIDKSQILYNFSYQGEKNIYTP